MSPDQTLSRDLIVIGASSGGVHAIEQVVGGLRRDLQAAVLVVVHVPAEPPSVLPSILTRAGTLPATHAVDGEVLEIGRIYVAPPDRHLLVERGRLRVVRGPRENGHRPAVDALFRSAGRAYGPQVIGVILTGALDDGTAGLRAVKERGGLAIVQDPEEALAPGMPRSALKNVVVDHCVTLRELPPLLNRVVTEPVETDVLATFVARDGDAVQRDSHRAYELDTHFSCPECHGVLYELDNGKEYRCRVGHLYSPGALLNAKSNDIETALWASVRSLEESATLSRRLGNRLGRRQAERLLSRAEESERYASLVRRVLTQGAGEAGQNDEAAAETPEGAEPMAGHS